MSVPSFAIVPLLLVAFVLLAIEHYKTNPDHQVRDLRFVMMAAAIVMMFAQLLIAPILPWLSLLLFGLALVWLVVAAALMRRRLRGG
jgi:uncharacterized membrane protein